ncbi:MAG: HAD-IG family 5'-nucleotidase [Polyangiaceae bacterium]|nr:HAD-IG family 5'-nucleotidase [Polyangiaceae bacterium]MCE7893185.1 HAD family hydrolase [Sorangiineae bacterium PRO1]MCL4749925.1 HAD-IG family 5'-nucleotidase [Myxococcales bacterium]
MSVPDDVAAPAPERRIFCNRTLNLRSIRAVGFDMDYTLVHYKTEVWERRAWERARARLLERGWPVGNLQFDPSFVILGLILDLELGNLVKASRFGYVMRAQHGTTPIDFERQRELYSRVSVELREPRWVFLNTLFSLSEALLYAQCVDLLDQGALEPGMGYAELYKVVRAAVDRIHAEGDLKAEIARAPDGFVELDPELGRCLLDLKQSGKKLLLVTNSEWSYTTSMMRYALDPFLPKGTSWRELFDVTVVMARKPDFFTAQSPMFEVVDETGLLRPVSEGMQQGRAYLGGNARMLEAHLGLSPEEILYVGDHLYSDVHVTKDLLRWRTTLVVRDIEQEILAVEAFRPKQSELSRLMAEKERVEHLYSTLRLALERLEHQDSGADPARLRERLHEAKSRLGTLDARIAPLAEEAGSLFNERWGLLMRAGLDKSYLARQLERYADAYTSRVSNFLAYTPYVYLRAPRVSLPHDSEV